MDNLTKFSEMLIELMDEKNINTDLLGKHIGVDGSTIRYWKEGRSIILLSNALKIVDYFDCSLEFLMGRTDTRLGFTPKFCPAFHDSLMRAMQELGMSRYRIVKDTTLGNGHFTRWKKGSDPQMDTLINLADYLNCTLDYLVGREG